MVLQVQGVPSGNSQWFYEFSIDWFVLSVLFVVSSVHFTLFLDRRRKKMRNWNINVLTQMWKTRNDVTSGVNLRPFGL